MVEARESQHFPPSLSSTLHLKEKLLIFIFVFTNIKYQVITVKYKNDWVN